MVANSLLFIIVFETLKLIIIKKRQQESIYDIREKGGESSNRLRSYRVIESSSKKKIARQERGKELEERTLLYLTGMFNQSIKNDHFVTKF